MAFQIDCVVKDDRYNPYERILEVGGRNPNGTRWRLSQTEVIHRIDVQGQQFVVRKNGSEVRVVTATSPHGHRYIKTEPDSLGSNNLLELTSCSFA